MTTPLESVQLIKYLRDHRFIGESCWADDEETARDHEGWECGAEVAEYDYWERAMRDKSAGHLVHETYHQTRRLAVKYWERHAGLDAEAGGDSLFRVSDSPAYQERATELEMEDRHHRAFASLGLELGEESRPIYPKDAAKR